MTASVTPSFVLFGAALILWSAAASISSYLSEDFSRQHGSRQDGSRGNVNPQARSGAPETPADLAALRKAAEANPQDAEVRVKLGYELVQRAQNQKDSSALMEAVQVLGQALQINPQHRQALLGLATLTLQAGVVDKAVDLYPRYLKLEPDDSRARTDYALALVEAKRFPEAEAELQQVLTKEPDSIPANMTLAYRYKVEGRIAEAKSRAEKALNTANDEASLKGIQAFIGGLGVPPAAPGGSAHGRPDQAAKASDYTNSADQALAAAASAGVAPAAAEMTSAAARVSNYFRNHPIVGPKVRGILWEGAATAVIKLENFPVEQMPPFVKAQFLQRITDSFADFPEKVVIKLVDAASEEQLLSVPVGPK